MGRLPEVPWGKMYRKKDLLAVPRAVLARTTNTLDKVPSNGDGTCTLICTVGTAAILSAICYPPSAISHCLCRVSRNVGTSTLPSLSFTSLLRCHLLALGTLGTVPYPPQVPYLTQGTYSTVLHLGTAGQKNQQVLLWESSSTSNSHRYHNLPQAPKYIIHTVYCTLGRHT